MLHEWNMKKHVQLQRSERYIWVFPKIGVGPPNHPILIRFSIIFTIHFEGFPRIFGKKHIGIGEYPCLQEDVMN